MKEPSPIDIVFIDLNDPGETLHNGVYTTMPFTEGQEFTIEIENKDPDFWDVKAFKKRFKVETIDFELKTRYPPTSTISSVTTTLQAYVYVIELE